MNHTSEDRHIRELVARIDEVATMGEKAKSVAKAFGEREAELRAELLTHMQLTDVRHALVGNVSVMIRTVRKVEVVDEAALVQALDERDLMPEYLVFDVARARVDAVKLELPGVFTKEQDQLVVSRKAVIK